MFVRGLCKWDIITQISRSKTIVMKVTDYESLYFQIEDSENILE